MQFRHLPILALASLVAAQDSGKGTQSLNATLSSIDQLSNLTSFLALHPDIASWLFEADDITILAPSNDAFAKYAELTETDAANNSALLTAFLQYHVLNGTYHVENGTYQAQQISNQSIFIPTWLTKEPYSNVTNGQVVEAVEVKNETVFYSGIRQSSTVISANHDFADPQNPQNENFTGGTIHIIDQVLSLPPNILNAALAMNLTSFRGALNTTDSIDTAYTHNITIFAPSNEAFDSIGSALVDLSTDDLQDILAYHIVEDVYYSTSLRDGTTLKTKDDDQELTITTNEDGTIFVNAAEVTTSDIFIANGVLHLIDNVLNPNNTSTPSASATSGAPGFSGSPASEQPFISGQPTLSALINPSFTSEGSAQSTAAGSESSGAAVPRVTGGVEYAALVGAGAAALLGF